MEISITCVANGNNKQCLLVWTIRRKFARASNKSLEWWLRLKRLAPSWGDGGVLPSQAEEAERQTVVWLFPGKSGCFNHLRSLSHRCAHCCAWPKPASRRARTRCVTKERITASNMEGKKKKNREGGPQPPIWHAQQVAGWHVSDATSTRKAAFSRSGLIEKIIKTFSFKNIWQRLLPKSGGCFYPNPLPTEKREFKGGKNPSKTSPTFLMAAKKGLERACLVSERDTKKYSLVLDR